jgi:DNA-binding response OmpR family regulator
VSKILIIEDEPDIAKVVRKRLMDHDYEAICAPDSYSGVQLARREAPDLIILDLMLPAGGGLRALQNLRLSTNTQNTPVVVLTGMQDPEYKRKVIQEGVDAYLEKPFESKALLRTIGYLLRHRKAG